MRSPLSRAHIRGPCGYPKSLGLGFRVQGLGCRVASPEEFQEAQTQKATKLVTFPKPSTLNP